MDCVLVIYRLSIQSSYLEDAETPADDADFDTVQFFVSAAGAWRIRTFSIDEDVHVYSLGDTQPETLVTVCTSTEKTYGEVIEARLEFRSSAGVDGLKRELQSAGWSPTLRQSQQHGFAFWVPEDSDYRTKSTPEG